jgi:hypothetical protein
MSIKYIDNRKAIDSDTVRILADNGLEANAKRTLCAARGWDDGETYWYIETNGDPEWLDADREPFMGCTDEEAIAYFLKTDREQKAE